MTRVVFFGTPELSVPFLQAIALDPSVEVVAVVTQPSRPTGRSKISIPSPVAKKAEQLSLPILAPPSLKTDDVFGEIEKLQADVFAVVAYGNLLPLRILSLPPRGSVNMHPSLLPSYRGPSPIQTAIANGDATTGITIMLLDSGMDTGPILAARSISLATDETQVSLIGKIMSIGPTFFCETLHSYLDGRILPHSQIGESSVTRLLDRESGRVDFNQDTALNLERRIRAYTPWPGVWTIWNGRRLKLLASGLAEKNGLEAGRVFAEKKQLIIGTIRGALDVRVLQLEGRDSMGVDAFVRGYGIGINGAKLG